MLSLCTLPADARVADFLRYWADALAERGLRTDQITLRMTRAEIGNYLGMTLESVSRALSRLARGDVIRFHRKGPARHPHPARSSALTRSSSAARRRRWQRARATGPARHRPAPAAIARASSARV